MSPAREIRPAIPRALQSKPAHIPDCIAQATGLSLDEITALRDQLTDLRARLDDS